MVGLPQEVTLARPWSCLDFEKYNVVAARIHWWCGGPWGSLACKNILWRPWMELSKGLIELAIFCGWHQRAAKQARQAALNSACWRRMREVRRASLTCLAEVCFATKETFLSCLYSLLASKYQDKHGLCLICTHYKSSDFATFTCAKSQTWVDK